MGIFKKIKEKKQKKKKERDFRNLIEYSKTQTNIAFMSPTFRGLYYFQQEYLPHLFFKSNIEMINILEKKEGLYQLVNEFNKNKKNICLISNSNTNTIIKRYSENKIIIRIHISNLDDVVTHKWKGQLCNSVYLCFDLINPDNNRYYSPRIFILDKAKYVLCRIDVEGRVYILTTESSTDLGYETIEEMFNVKNS